ncbi:hypothetical protein SAMN05444169_6335 [Bradyrhizobium erythrophlei]|uniref:Uncharacterized protein n=2 Tax=Bradyrhizobium erythrophlei TaxID=1437360 RepID=A0A1M5R408_9BRAD|nr:hypothetical protein SAMN05444169_6335 [Bradyrhizobium erythrophlei]
MTKCPRPKAFKDQMFMPSDAVLRAVGRVAAVSAGIEDELHAIYWKLLSVTDAVGVVITGDMRVSRLCEDLLKLAKATKVPPRIYDDLADVIADLKSKNQKRNEVIHWIWDKGGVAPPAYKAGRQNVKYTAKIVNELADDLIWIEARLTSHALTDKGLQDARAKLGSNADLYAPAPWLVS